MLSIIAVGGVAEVSTRLSPMDAALSCGLDSTFAVELQPALDRLGLTDRRYDSFDTTPQEVLYLSHEGLRVFEKYRRMAARGIDVRSERYVAATRNILQWRDADKDMAGLSDIHQTPFGSVFGDPFREEELAEAFDELIVKGLLKSLGSGEDPTLGLDLTPTGRSCVIRHGADIDAFERASARSGVNNTYNLGQVGNFVAGDNHGTMNSWTDVASSSEAAGLLAAAIRLATLNGEIPDSAAQLAKECHDGLIEASKGEPTQAAKQGLAAKVKALGMLAASKSAETTATLLTTEGVTSLLDVLAG